MNSRTSAPVSFGVTGLFVRALVGGIVGALLSVVTLWTVLALQQTHLTPGTGEVAVAMSRFAAECGALIGCIMGPIALGVVVGRVPLWRATVHTATGTFVGAIALSWLWRIPALAIRPGILWSAIGGIVGCLVAAFQLRRASRAKALGLTRNFPTG